MILTKSLISFQKKININFKNSNLLRQALTHPSYYKDNKKQNKMSSQFERLEFLGDRVLGLIIAKLLFSKFVSFNEGDLSRRYSYLVQKNFYLK